ncbi:MAG: DUF2231 domain-containing protein [Solirubrobacteraceae bacterium]
MSTDAVSMHGRRGVEWRRAEFVLVLLGFLGFLTLPIRIKTIYSGLPAHPLFIHVPVVLIPISVLGAIVCIARPAWLDRYGVVLSVTAIVAMSSIFLSMQAGAELRGALNLQGQAASLIQRHSHAAHILAVVFVLFTAVLILTFAAQRISGGMPTGLAIADRLLSPRSNVVALRIVLLMLALVSAYMVFKVGDLGAKAVWAGRLQQSAPAG